MGLGWLRKRFLEQVEDCADPPAVNPVRIVVDLKTPLPNELPLGRGQVLFMTGWLRPQAPAALGRVAGGTAVSRFPDGARPLSLMPESAETIPTTARRFLRLAEVPDRSQSPVAAPSDAAGRYDSACDLSTTRISARRHRSRRLLCRGDLRPRQPGTCSRQIARSRAILPTGPVHRRRTLQSGSDERVSATTTNSSHAGRLGFYYNFERAMSLVPPDADFVALSDQDDCWYPEKLATLLAAFTSDETTLVYSDMRIVDGADNRLADTFWNIRKNCWTNLASLILANTVTGAASMFRRGLLDRVLPFPPQFGGQTYHDHWLAMTALALGPLRFLPQPL